MCLYFLIPNVHRFVYKCFAFISLFKSLGEEKQVTEYIKGIKSPFDAAGGCLVWLACVMATVGSQDPYCSIPSYIPAPLKAAVAMTTTSSGAIRSGRDGRVSKRISWKTAPPHSDLSTLT